MNKKEQKPSFGSMLYAAAKESGVNLTDAKAMTNFIKEGMKDLLEGALKAEFDDHLGYEKHEITDSTNSRNGVKTKTVKSSLGQFKIESPRDRDASFQPKIVPKKQRDISDIELKIIRMYSMGCSTRDIVETTKDIYGIDLNPNYISKMVAKLMPNIHKWKSRKLREKYAFMFIDGIRFRVRQDGTGKEVSCYIIIGITFTGQKEFVGYWISDSESASNWASIFSEIKARGVKKILIITADNLKGISQAIKAVYPQTLIQKCVVHQIRNSLRFVSSKDKKQFVIDMKKIYQAGSYNLAKQGLNEFEMAWGNKYKYAIRSWKSNFEELTSFYDFPVEIRKMMYTTNLIENVNYQIRRVTKTKGSFTSVEALEKLVFLRLLKIEENWTKGVRHWGVILNQLDLQFNLENDI